MKRALRRGGDLSGVRGDLSGVRGDVHACGLTAHDRARGIDVADLISPVVNP